MDIFVKHILQTGTITQDKPPRNRLADVVNIVKNLNAENAELMDRVNELSLKVEHLEETNRRLNDRLIKFETIQKADMASIRTVIELMRKELEVYEINKKNENSNSKQIFSSHYLNRISKLISPEHVTTMKNQKFDIFYGLKIINQFIY